MKLTATAVKNAKPGRHSDGEGMYLLVTDAGQKYWRFDYRFLGKYKTLAGTASKHSVCGRRNCSYSGSVSRYENS